MTLFYAAGWENCGGISVLIPRMRIRWEYTQNSAETVSGRIENLKPWRPGQSGNPGGRPKRDALTTALREQIEAQVSGAGTQTVAEAIAAALVSRALDGRPPQALAHRNALLARAMAENMG